MGQIPPKGRWILQVTYRDGGPQLGVFAVAPPERDERGARLPHAEYEKLWLPVRFLKTPAGVKGYVLAEGDVVRMGRLKFRVSELCYDKSGSVQPVNLHDLLLGEQSEELNSEDSPAGIKTEFPCRICLSEYYECENPLVSLCKCDGTMKFVHMQCL